MTDYLSNIRWNLEATGGESLQNAIGSIKDLKANILGISKASQLISFPAFDNLVSNLAVPRDQFRGITNAAIVPSLDVIATEVPALAKISFDAMAKGIIGAATVFEQMPIALPKDIGPLQGLLQDIQQAQSDALVKADFVRPMQSSLDVLIDQIISPIEDSFRDLPNQAAAPVKTGAALLIDQIIAPIEASFASLAREIEAPASIGERISDPIRSSLLLMRDEMERESILAAEKITNASENVQNAIASTGQNIQASAQRNIVGQGGITGGVAPGAGGGGQGIPHFQLAQPEDLLAGGVHNIDRILQQIAASQRTAGMGIGADLADSLKLAGTSAADLHRNALNIRKAMFEVTPAAKSVMSILNQWNNGVQITSAQVRKLQAGIRNAAGDANIFSQAIFALERPAASVLQILQMQPDALRQSKGIANELITTFNQLGVTAKNLNAITGTQELPLTDEVQEAKEALASLLPALKNLHLYAVMGKPISPAYIEQLSNAVPSISQHMATLAEGNKALKSTIQPTDGVLQQLLQSLAMLKQSSINASSAVSGLVTNALQPSIQSMRDNAAAVNESSSSMGRYIKALGSLSAGNLGLRETLRLSNIALRELGTIIQDANISGNELAQTTLSQHVPSLTALRDATMEAIEAERQRQRVMREARVGIDESVASKRTLVQVISGKLTPALQQLKVATLGALNAEKQRQMVNFRGVPRTQEAAAALTGMQSAFQGLMLGMGLFQGNLRMIAFNMIFLSSSLLKISVPIAALTVLFGGLGLSMVRAVTAAQGLTDTRLSLQRMTGSIEEAGVAFQYATELAIRFGFKTASVTGGLGALTQASLRTSDNIAAITRLALGTGMAFDEAADVYISAIGETEAALSSLTDVGIHFTKEEDAKFTAMGRAATAAEANRRIMERYADAHDLASNSLSRLRTRIAEANTAIFALLGTPFVQDFLVPIYRAIANSVAQTHQLVRALMQWVNVSGFWEDALRGWRKGIEILMPTLRDLGVIMRIGLVSAVLIVMRAFRALGDLFARFAAWVNALWQGFKRWIQVFKPFHDAIRRLAQALKDLDFRAFLTALKDAFANLPEPIREAIENALLIALVLIGPKIIAALAGFAYKIIAGLAQALLGKAGVYSWAAFGSSVASLLMAALLLGLYEVYKDPELKTSFQDLVSHIQDLFKEGEIVEGLKAVGATIVSLIGAGMVRLITGETLGKDTKKDLQEAFDLIKAGDYKGALDVIGDTVGKSLQENLYRALLIAIIGAVAAIVLGPKIGFSATVLAGILLPKEEGEVEETLRPRLVRIIQGAVLAALLAVMIGKKAGAKAGLMAGKWAVILLPVVETVSQQLGFSLMDVITAAVVIAFSKPIWAGLVAKVTPAIGVFLIGLDAKIAGLFTMAKLGAKLGAIFGPKGIIIGAVVGVLALLAGINFEQISLFTERMGKEIEDAFFFLHVFMLVQLGKVRIFFVEEWNKLFGETTDSTNSFSDSVKAAHEWIKVKLTNAINFLSPIIRGFGSVLDPLIGAFNSIASAASGVVTAVNAIANAIRGLPNLPAAWQARSPSEVEQSIRGVTSAFKDAQNIRVPGFMQDLGGPMTALAGMSAGSNAHHVTNITIEVSGNYILDDKTASNLADKLAAKIDERLLKRASHSYNLGFVLRP